VLALAILADKRYNVKSFDRWKEEEILHEAIEIRENADNRFFCSPVCIWLYDI
jgi:hypothetical protein